MKLYYQGILICVFIYSAALLLLGASISAALFVCHVAVVPLIFKYSKFFRRHLVFCDFVQWPPFLDLEDPAACGIEGARNLSVEYHSKVDDCDIKIGIWHILPKSDHERLKSNFEGTSDKEELNRLLDKELANSDNPIMFYCHGNSNSRAASHRIQLYKVFQQMNYHTIAFDYRGKGPPQSLETKKRDRYGDSSNVAPCEDGVVEDSLLVYEWVLDVIKHNDDKNTPPVFVWGHSLGSGIAARLVGELAAAGKPAPRGLILEAPFNNLADEVRHHPGSQLVTWLPYYDTSIIKPFREATTREASFQSDVTLRRHPSLPILILHDKDDMVVSFIVGVKLFQAIKASRSERDAPVTLHAYDKREGFGHTWICRAKDLADVVGDFVKKHQ